MRRNKRQPWWTYPIAFVATLAVLVRVELLTKLIWRGVVKRTFYHKAREFLDEKFPPCTARRHKYPHVRNVF